MSEDSLNALGKFDDSIQRLKAGGEAAKNMLGTVLIPSFRYWPTTELRFLEILLVDYLRLTATGRR